MPSRNKNPSAGGKLYGPFQIGEGGHGKQTPREACEALGAFPRFDIGLGLNPIPLDSNGKIPVHYWGNIKLIEAGLDGPSVLNAGALGCYFLTTYDNFTTYEVTASKGEVRRDGRIIYFRAPLEAGEVSFFVDAREYTIQVINEVFEKPSILSPENNYEGGVTSITLLSSTAVIKGIPELLYHDSSDWEIYSDAQLNNLYKRAYKSQNKTAILFTGLDLDKDYYFRVRYNSLDGEQRTSAWSDVIHIRTSIPKFVVQPTIQSPQNQQLNLQAPVTVTASAFATSGYGESLDNPSLLLHASSDWLISTTENFSNIVAMSSNDVVNKTSWLPPNLGPLTLYYVKVRYRNSAVVSTWSNAISFMIA